MLVLLWYPDGSDNPWQAWYTARDARVRARHDVVMRALEAGYWQMDYFRTLTDLDGLGEIRITKGVAHRLIGRLDRKSKMFTVEIACIHKGSQYYPRDSMNTAAVRIKEIDQGKSIPVRCEQPRFLPRS